MTLLLSPRPVESAMGSVGAEVFSLKDGMYPDTFSTKPPADPTMVFFNIDYGKVKKQTKIKSRSNASLILSLEILN